MFARATLLVYGLILASLAVVNVHATPPNVVIILVDDLGESGVEFNNPYIKGPNVKQLREEGLLLTRSYVFKYCSPTRGSLLSGRYPLRLTSMRSNIIPWSRPDGLNLGFDLLPQRLKKEGYTTHHVGKWHLGFHNSSFLPVNRGFDSFFGYLSGMQDHFDQTLGGFATCHKVVDLTANVTAAYGQNGTYSGTLYAGYAERAIVTSHQLQKPMFLNYWMQNTHAPFEVPEKYSGLYNFTDKGMNTFNGMVSVVDEAVGNVTDLLKQLGMWNNTLVIYTHDNGAPLGGGGSNYPLRGGKNSNFEGGVRVPTILSGGAVPESIRNKTLSSLFHVSDWLPTILHAVTGESPVPLADSVSDDIPYDGFDQWNHLLALNKTAPRNEIILDHCLMPGDGTGCNHFSSDRKGGVGALIVGDWKLIAGPNGGSWSNFTNGTHCSSFSPVACETQCLYNITADSGEHNDLSATHPEVLAMMINRFNEFQSTYHPPTNNPAPENDAFCEAAEQHGNFMSPWTSPAPAPPPTPLGPCQGGSGSPGWEIRNNTGGGGPGFAHFKVDGLDMASVTKCRGYCCATAKCASVTIHTDDDGRTDCYLNPQSSAVAPYAREDTLMAFVNRTEPAY